MPIGHSKSLLPIIIGALMTACSGSSPPSEPVTQPAAPSANASPAVATSQASSEEKLSAERIMQLQHEGYKLVNRDGQTYYCRTEAKTGSHLARDTVCMTEAEIIALREQTKQGLGRITREAPPPQGR